VRLLTKFTNPVWHEASKLSPVNQVRVGILIIGRDFLREVVRERLVDPVIQIFESGRFDKSFIGPCAETGASQFRERLIDEAVLGLLRCCRRPSADLSGKLTDQLAQELPDALRPFALAGANGRRSLTAPDGVDEVEHSAVVEEACDQVLSSFTEILSIPYTSLITILRDEGFARRWEETCEIILDGLLIAAARMDDKVIIKKARSLSASLPRHLMPHILSTINRLAEE